MAFSNYSLFVSRGRREAGMISAANEARIARVSGIQCSLIETARDSLEIVGRWPNYTALGAIDSVE